MNTSAGLDDLIRRELESLAEAFKWASGRYPPLFHDMFARWPDRREGMQIGQSHAQMNRTDVVSFLDVVAAVRGDEDSRVVTDYESHLELFEKTLKHEPQKWHGPHSFSPKLGYYDIKVKPPKFCPVETNLYWFGRFHGNLAGLSEFESLAGSLFLVIQKILETHSEGGWPGALFMLHFMARKYPSPRLRVEESVWGWCPNPRKPLGEQNTERLKHLEQSDRGGSFLFPLVWSLKNDVFLACDAAIRQLLAPNSILVVGEDQTKTDVLGAFYPSPVSVLASRPKRVTKRKSKRGASPRHLVKSGKKLVRLPHKRSKTTSNSIAKRQSSTESIAAKKSEPRWDEARRELWFGRVLLKRFGKVPATAQIAILQAFHAEKWTPRVAPKMSGQNPAQRQNDAIYHLNKSLHVKSLIYFDGDGDSYVRWNHGSKPTKSPKRRK